MNRRGFLALAAVSAAATASASAAARDRIAAVAFDAFVIFDPRPISLLAEELFAGKGPEVMNAWRTRQFEYTWLRTLTRSYADFWQVTGDALEFACAAQKIELSSASRDRLLDAYLHLKAWPDVLPTLQALKAADIRLALLSNFTEGMLEANIRSAGLQDFFEARLSTDAVRAFKPDARAYQMGVDHFGLPKTAIAFAAFAGWDAVGAKRFGYPVYWCNRSGQPAEILGAPADRESPSTADLASFIR